jgi:hypothetical protein
VGLSARPSYNDVASLNRPVIAFGPKGPRLVQQVHFTGKRNHIERFYLQILSVRSANDKES